jgi:ribosomal protein S5(archaeal type)/S2(eukaryote cytosolic type)
MSLAESWQPRTKLGSLVKEGSITSVDQIFENNFRIQEPEIVDILIPNLQVVVLYSRPVQKQTASGELTRFESLVVVGDKNGHLGLGLGKARQTRSAIEKATNEAKLNLIPVLRGCGSWECSCGRPHSVPYVTIGRMGSVRIKIMPAPLGLGLVAGDFIKPIFTLAGISDVWTWTKGETRNRINFALSTYDALKKLYKFTTF